MRMLPFSFRAVEELDERRLLAVAADRTQVVDLDVLDPEPDDQSMTALTSRSCP